MKGVIIIPTFYKKTWLPESNGKDLNFVFSGISPFFYLIRDTFGFELRYADEVDVPPDTDVVIMWGVPYHNRPELIPGLLELNKKIKLIMFTGDIHCHGNNLCLENKIKVFNRCDLIIAFADEYFRKTYPQFLPKYKFMPWWFAPHERYIQLPFNNHPKMRCLLSGAIPKKFYPLRNFIVRKANNVDQQKARGDDYAKLLNSYFCCVTTSSVFNAAIKKYFEIPAAGSLLIANESPDLKTIGFIPHQHYVPITKSDALKTITHCLENPDEYNHIRKEGMRFVRENHSVNNRIESMKLLFEGERNE